MALEVIGAGLGRTGTTSLKQALERLLGGPCYHMFDLLQHPEHVPIWEQALDDGAPDWNLLFSGYRAAVDWIAATFYDQLATAYPQAIVLLSTRDPEEWWRSVNRTAFESLASNQEDDVLTKALTPTRELTLRMLNERFTPRWTEEAEAKRAYSRHNASVRATVPAGRPVEWQLGDGWAPICEALGSPIPDEPFPHVNTSAEFRSWLRLRGLATWLAQPLQPVSPSLRG